MCEFQLMNGGKTMDTSMYNMEKQHKLGKLHALERICHIVDEDSFREIGSSVSNLEDAFNIKKGQFLAPEQMKSLVKKVEDSGHHKIMLTDRGVTFGYNNLVSDFRAIPIMKEFGYPVVFDATHSVQKPGMNGSSSGGNREYVEPLAKAAVAMGADVLFFEVHPDPDNALSDGPNMVKLDDFEGILERIMRVYNAVN